MNDQTVLLKALGLVTSYNTLDTPPGTFAEASNVVIRKEGVVEKRRGFHLYGTNLGGHAKQLLTYQNRILRHYGTVLDWDSDNAGEFLPFQGSYLEPDGTRIRSLEYGGNLFFTTSTGAKKISAANTDELLLYGQQSGFIKDAGGPKGLDISATLTIDNGSSAGWFLADSAVAYRYLLGYTDRNDIDVPGSVSQRIDIYNYLSSLNQNDYNRFLLALDEIVRNDATTRIGDATAGEDDYESDPVSGNVGSTDGPVVLRNHLIALGAKLDDRVVIAENGGTPELSSHQRLSTASADLVFNTSMVDYVEVGDHLLSSTFTGVGAGEFNNIQLVVTNIATTTVTVAPATDFTTTDGAPIADTAPTIKRSKYSNNTLFPQPDAPSSPATHDELLAIQEYFQSFVTALQSEPIGIISSASQSTYLDSFDLTSTATTQVRAALPEGLTTDYYIRLYRSKSNTGQATGTTPLSETTPLDELQLAYEAYLTDTDITNGYVIIDDITPDALLGAYLYTNQFSGEGILQNNQPPPVATDIALFKNYAFYSNTRTKHRRTLTLVGVAQMIEDYNNGTTPMLMITNTNNETEEYTFVLGEAESTSIQAVADVANSLNGTYFLINAGEDTTEYYVWFKTSGGVSTDPALAGKTGIKVYIDTDDTASEVARKTASTLLSYSQDFTVASTANPFIVDANQVGYTTSASAGTSGFTITTVANGQGQDASANEVLLSNSDSPSQAIDETARSLVHVINANTDSILYADYLFDPTQPPGKIAFEARDLNDYTIYFLGNNENTGSSFVVDLSPLYVSNTLVTASTSIGTPTITTSAAHGLQDGDKVLLINTGAATIDGYWEVDNTTNNTFDITTNALATTTSGAMLDSENAVASSDEQKVNRLYYSKLQQPESVPLLNYLDIGAGNKAILRIISLSHNLYVFKEDGVYRLNGDNAPFSVDLVDPSSIIIASETAAVLNGSIYFWSRQGISRLNDGGIDLISKAIDDVIKRISSNNYPNFKQASWALGYESDNTYYLSTLVEASDTLPQIMYKFCTLTDTWVTADTAASAGVVMQNTDIMYIGASDVPYVEKERKNFDRTDFSDRQYITTIGQDKYDIYDKSIELPNLTNVQVDDVLVQEQSITMYQFNQLLRQLDTDPSVPSADYFSTLEMVQGDEPRAKLIALATKLDSELTTGYMALIPSIVNKDITNISAEDPTEITSTAHGLQTGRVIQINGSTTIPSVDGSQVVTVIDANTFTITEDVLLGESFAAGVCTFTTLDYNIEDLKGCYNAVVGKLNTDPLAAYNNYPLITYNTKLETMVTGRNILTNKVTLMNVLDFLQGDITIFQQIQSSIKYNAITFGDPINSKHLRDLQLLFINKAFTKAIIGFNTDLVPYVFEHPFNGDGNGIFGLSHQFGKGFFGGNSHAAPYRTMIPRDYHRCRFIQIQFKHNVARESFILFGTTLTGNTALKERAYR